MAKKKRHIIEGVAAVALLIVCVITFGVILLFNLIAGLIPVYVTLRKTPAQILARTDI